jgi:hypothetical protein
MRSINLGLKLLAFVVALVASIDVNAKQDRCVSEREAVDHIQDRMRKGYRIGEHLRDRERKAKAEYLQCMREPRSTAKQAPKHTVKPKTYSNRDVVRLPSKRRTTKIKPMRARSTSYHNYKGAKLAAWEEFFTEPEECLKLKGDMNLFVKCSKNRKEAKKLFESRWDSKTHALRLVRLD